MLYQCPVGLETSAFLYRQRNCQEQGKGFKRVAYLQIKRLRRDFGAAKEARIRLLLGVKIEPLEKEERKSKRAKFRPLTRILSVKY